MRTLTRRLAALLLTLLLIVGRHRRPPEDDPDRDECEGEGDDGYEPRHPEPAQHRSADADWSPLAELAAVEVLPLDPEDRLWHELFSSLAGHQQHLFDAAFARVLGDGDDGADISPEFKAVVALALAVGDIELGEWPSWATDTSEMALVGVR